MAIERMIMGEDQFLPTKRSAGQPKKKSGMFCMGRAVYTSLWLPRLYSSMRGQKATIQPSFILIIQKEKSLLNKEDLKENKDRCCKGTKKEVENG